MSNIKEKTYESIKETPNDNRHITNLKVHLKLDQPENSHRVLSLSPSASMHVNQYNLSASQNQTEEKQEEFDFTKATVSKKSSK